MSWVRRGGPGASYLKHFLVKRGFTSVGALFITPYLFLTPLFMLAIALTVLLVTVLLPVSVIVGTFFRALSGKDRLVILCYWSDRNASTRFRITKVFRRLADRYDIRIIYPTSIGFSDRYYDAVTYYTFPGRDIYYFVLFLSRTVTLLVVPFFDAALVQYELYHVGPYLFEYMVRFLSPRLIYDLDDATFHVPRHEKYLPGFTKVCDLIVVGNQYLKDWIVRLNENVTVIPTCPDIEEFKGIRKHTHGRLVIGWIGNPTNIQYLDLIKGALERLIQEYDFELRVVTSGDYRLDFTDVPLVKVPWTISTEGREIHDFDIGLMPVPDTIRGRGKCGFKLLEYMAAEVPAVASPVGVNRDIIDNGYDGFLAETQDQWYNALLRLVSDKGLRREMGRRGKNKVKQGYTLDVCVKQWDDVLGRFLKPHEKHNG